METGLFSRHPQSLINMIINTSNAANNTKGVFKICLESNT